MNQWTFTKGLHELGEGIYAYIQPDGSWCLNNAGLIVDGQQAMLVDTLTDLAHTQEMLDSIYEKTNASINSVVITHGNIDHWLGNELVKDAEIIATEKCAEEMKGMPPEMLAQLIKGAPQLGETGEYFIRCFGKFNFEGITPTYPTKTFHGQLELKLGNTEIRLIDVGPAHTTSDLLVYVPEKKVVFAGDILFINGTPLMWEGPVSNWIKACNLMLEMDAETFVPGHGPITDKKGVEEVKGYWKYLEDETRKRFDAGMNAFNAAQDIPLGKYESWGESERVCVNVNTLYNEFRAEPVETNILELFGSMAQYAKNKK